MTEILHFLKWCGRKILLKMYSGLPAWLYHLHCRFVRNLRFEAGFAFVIWLLLSSLTELAVAIVTIIYGNSNQEIRELMPVTFSYTSIAIIVYTVVSIIHAAYLEFQQEREDLLDDLRRSHNVR
jgi:hypothetical protein